MPSDALKAKLKAAIAKKVLDPPPPEVRCIVCGCTPAGSHSPCDCCDEHVHCAICAQPEDYCQCCDCHDEYPCPGEPLSLSGKGGSSTVTPWEARGISVQVSGKYNSWQDAWPTLAKEHTKLDPCSVAADFYVLDAIRHAILNRGLCPRESFLESYDLCDLQHDAEQQFWMLVVYLDRVFCEYVEMACGGELRHHGAVGGRVLSGHRRTAWAEWKVIHDEVGNQALLDMADLFAEFGGGAFGGARWGNAAKMLYERLEGRVTPQQWVDQVFALVHNGGVFLNKLDWAVTNSRQWHLSALQEKVLPAQARDGWSTLVGVASKPTLRLWNEYWMVSNRVRMRHGVSPALNPHRSKSKRTLCACGTNPRNGHLMSCRWWISGKLNEMTPYIVEEDDYPAFQWHTWELPSEKLPIGPNGEVHILPSVQYAVHVWVHSAAVIVQRRHYMDGAELMTQVIGLKSLMVEMDAWWPVLESQYQWRVQLLTDSDDIVLASCNGNPQTKEELTTVSLPLGFILPHLMPDLDWSQVQGGVGI